MEASQIAMHELKAALSATVARAAAGEVIEVTSHGKPVARLVAATAANSQGLGGLVAEGAARWSGGKPDFAPPVVLPEHTKTLSDMVLEDRG